MLNKGAIIFNLAENMKKGLLLILLFINFTSLYAQNFTKLNTPFYWLKDARSKAGLKDTTGAFLSLENAVKEGLFDVQVLSYSKTFNAIFSIQQTEKIKAGILENRKKIESPSSIKIVTQDIDNFWKLYPAINDSAASKIFLNEYIGNGSAGLKTFYQIRMNSSIQTFIEKIRAKQTYYRSIKDISKQFKTMRPQFIAAANKLETLYPESVFPPIYFIIGNLNNVGTADGYAGLLIGAEHLCRSAHADTSQLTPNDKLVLFDTSLAVPLIVHEYVHFQQKNKLEKTLIEFSVMEGVADFITYLITGQYTNPDVYKYGFENERAVWKKFSTEMAGENTDNWLFNTYNPQTGYPGNLGYFVGFRICERYYLGSGNKQNAIKELLEIKDFNQILSQSGYRGE
jgi:hypothetical protein